MLQFEILQLLAQGRAFLDLQALFDKFVEGGLEDICIPAPKEDQIVGRSLVKHFFDGILDPIAPGNFFKIMDVLIVDLNV